MAKPCSTGCIAIAGNDSPHMENDSTPHKEAKLSPKRSVGRVPIISMPMPCEANTRQRVANSIGNIPLLQGKCRKPYRTKEDF